MTCRNCDVIDQTWLLVKDKPDAKLLMQALSVERVTLLNLEKC